MTFEANLSAPAGRRHFLRMSEELAEAARDLGGMYLRAGVGLERPVRIVAGVSRFSSPFLHVLIGGLPGRTSRERRAGLQRVLRHVLSQGLVDTDVSDPYPRIRPFFYEVPVASLHQRLLAIRSLRAALVAAGFSADEAAAIFDAARDSASVP